MAGRTSRPSASDELGNAHRPMLAKSHSVRPKNEIGSVRVVQHPYRQSLSHPQPLVIQQPLGKHDLIPFGLGEAITCAVLIVRTTFPRGG